MIHRVLFCVLIFIGSIIPHTSAIQCWHCNDKPQWTLVVADKLPVCNETLNATTGQKEYGEKRECGKAACTSIVAMEPTKIYDDSLPDSFSTPPTDSAATNKVVERGCVEISDGADHLMKCFPQGQGQRKRICYCNHEDDCNGSYRISTESWVFGILYLFAGFVSKSIIFI